MPPSILPARWVPHVTIAYSTADQPVALVVAATGPRVAAARSRFGEVSLVAQRGSGTGVELADPRPRPDRPRPIGPVPIGAAVIGPS